jgi:hypothetical protein
MKLSRRGSIAAVLVAAVLSAAAMRMFYFSQSVPVQDAVVGTLHDINHHQETITVTTPMGAETLTLPSSVLVHQGARKLTVNELARHADERVKVWYRASDGRRVVTEVRLAAEIGDRR